ncbi:hypothetical protein ACWCPM_07345 [Streptomyces sp. NPDC002309]
MLVASAVWSTAMVRPGFGVPGPDTHGYQLTQRACRTVQLPAMSLEVAPMDSTSVMSSGLSEDPALDHLRCSIHLRPDPEPTGAEPGWFVDYHVSVSVTLHKKADPVAEFDAERRVTALGVVAEEEVEAVAGVGDGAYLITSDLGSTELRVRDGGAVLSLGLSAMVSYLGDGDGDGDGDGEGEQAGEAPETPDVSTYRSAMLYDMRALMTHLKK